jgi:acetyl-CoA carboxylase biotin carboxyl carrier protein
MAKSPKNSTAQSETDTRGQGIDLSEVERILDFMQKHGLEEFEYERNGLRLRMKKPGSAPQGAFRAIPSSDIVIATAPGQAPANTAAEVKEPASEEEISEDLHVVKSPIVGTFYASSSPGAGPFVTVGSHIEIGQVLCIIEAMKLMNEIESDVTGEVARIFVENGHPVEYGEPLFGIHPHRKK